MRWAARRLPVARERVASSDDDLVRWARRGDRAAFGELVTLHQDQIYRLAMGMVGADAAEDVAQNAFIRAWRGLEAFDGRSTFGTWLHRIAVNLCLDELRRTARFRPLPLDDDAWEDEAADPSDMIAQRDESLARREALAWALERLPSEERLLLHLRTIDERSYDEIAHTLGINARTVGTRLFRARARLRHLVSERMEEPAHDMR